MKKADWLRPATLGDVARRLDREAYQGNVREALPWAIGWLREMRDGQLDPRVRMVGSTVVDDATALPLADLADESDWLRAAAVISEACEVASRVSRWSFEARREALRAEILRWMPEV